MKTKLGLYIVILAFVNPVLADIYEVSPNCKEFVIKNQVKALEQVETFRSEITKELREGGHENQLTGYLILGALFSSNPYSGLKKLENGIKKLAAGEPLSRKQSIILEDYCANHGEITMDLVTQ